MGFLKDLKKLKDQGKELQKEHSVKDALAGAQAQMEAANLGAELAARGERASAQVVASRATGVMVNYAPMLEVDVMVFREGQPPYPAQIQMSSAVGMVTPGQEISVLVDPDDPTRVAIG